jgi:hypothetical protein
LSTTIFKVALPILPKPLIATFNIRNPLFRKRPPIHSLSADHGPKC